LSCSIENDFHQVSPLQATLLFDLEADPEEKRDISAQYPDIVRNLEVEN
jgi:hypothetical protein